MGVSGAQWLEHRGFTNPLKLYTEFLIYELWPKFQRNLQSPKGLEPLLQLFYSSPFCLNPLELAHCLLAWPVSLASGDSLFLFYFWTLHSAMKQDDSEKRMVNFHVSIEINFLWRDMPATVFIEYCCLVLMSNLKNVLLVTKILLSPVFFSPWSLPLCWIPLDLAPNAWRCFSGSCAALIIIHCPQNKVLTRWPGICALYNLTLSCCSSNCSMFQANCAPCRCPSPVCALFPLGLHGMFSLFSPSVTDSPSFKAFLLSIPQSEIPSSLTSIVLGSYGFYGVRSILIHALLFMTCVSLLPYKILSLFVVGLMLILTLYLVYCLSVLSIP